MKRDIERIESTEYDVVVVGGGIQGVALAWEGARRGLSVALLERDDFGGATSANSQRMIHGGVRYLQHADFYRLRRSVRERRELMRQAPHLIQPVPILVPTYGRGMNSRFVIRCGMGLYELMSMDRNRGIEQAHRIPRNRALSLAQCLEAEPGVAREGLTGAVIFHDAITRNSERLTLAFAMAASRAGADLANHTPVEELLLDGSRVNGVRALDSLSGRGFTVRTRLVLNAAGPWTGELARLKIPLVRALVLLTPPVNERYALAIQSREVDSHAVVHRGGRHYFITPWRGFCLAGQGEKSYSGDPGSYRVTRAEISELLDEINKALPAAKLSLKDVRRAFTGLLPAADMHDTAISRHDRIIDHEKDGSLSGLISVIGVKYTTARSLASRVIDITLSKLGTEGRPGGPEAITGLAGRDLEKYIREAESGTDPRADAATVRELIHLYGTDYERVLAIMDEDPGWAETISSRPLLIGAQIAYAVREEMASKLSDVVLRRTELGMFGMPEPGALRRCAELMGREMGWDSAVIEEEILEVESEYNLS